MRVELSLQLDVIPVVFSHCSCYVFSFLNFPNFCRAEQFAEAATDAVAPFDCKCTSYTSRSPLGMAASIYGRLHGVCFHCVHACGGYVSIDSQPTTVAGQVRGRACLSSSSVTWRPLIAYCIPPLSRHAGGQYFDLQGDLASLREDSILTFKGT